MTKLVVAVKDVKRIMHADEADATCCVPDDQQHSTRQPWTIS